MNGISLHRYEAGSYLLMGREMCLDLIVVISAVITGRDGEGSTTSHDCDTPE
jgi:hypothetical protein